MCRAYDIHFYPTFRVSAACPSHGLGAWGRRLPAQGLLCAGVTSRCTPVGLQGHTRTVRTAPAHTQQGL